MNPELDKMSHEELVKLQKDVRKALDSYQERQKQRALVEMQEVARRHGLDLSDIVGGKKKGQIAAPKFRHPDDPSLTWAGKGRKPRWLNDELAAGRDIDEFRI